MAIKTMTIKTGATMGPTGGSDLVFGEIGGARPGTTRIAPTTDTTSVSRRSADFTFTPAPVAAGDPTGYGRDRWVTTYRVPRDVHGDGSVYLPAIYRLEITEPVTTTGTNKTAARTDFVQLVTDSEATDFYTVGSQN
jgi:hypothetical protein